MGKNKPACDRKSGARFQMAKQAKLSFGSSGTWTEVTYDRNLK
jgi:hypothetical protein